jgi:anti-anti-sigma factor
MSSNNDSGKKAFETKTENDTVIIQAINPSIQHTEAREFENLFETLTKKGCTRFILDLSLCEYISSEGLSCTASSWKWCFDEGNGNMVIIVPKDPENEVRHLFEIIGLSRMVGSAMQPDIAHAMRYLKEFS